MTIEAKPMPYPDLIRREVKCMIESLDNCEYDTPNIQIKKAVEDGKGAAERIQKLLVKFNDDIVEIKRIGRANADEVERLREIIRTRTTGLSMSKSQAVKKVAIGCLAFSIGAGNGMVIGHHIQLWLFP